MAHPQVHDETRTRLNWFLIAHPNEVIESYAEDGSLHEAISEEIQRVRDELNALKRERWIASNARADKAEAFLEREGYRQCDILGCNCGSWHDHRERAIRLAGALHTLQLILDEPFGCPMCDSGTLRDPEQAHWDRCGFARAAEVVAANDADTVED